ncbi:MAG: sodium-dependent transporter [Gemmatimonadetes bacterium]|nr:sodium-dependent transporter [Gemmatimonadota bacterium]
MSSKSEVFSSRWGMLLAMLGMAVGTGNIWRFPRVAASNGGGSFLIAWAVFLLAWSVPLLILEFGMGKGTRQGAIGAFVKTLGPGFAWMGAWVAFVATAIMFYYSVVMGWTLRFFVGTITGEVPGATPSAFWDGFHSTPGALVTHVVAMTLGVFVVSRGVKGIETAAKFLIPSLIFLVFVLALRAVTLPGASAGLAFLFTPDWAALGDYHVWLEALTQNAWDTGAGWGLVLTYAVYMRANEDTALNAFVIGFGNNAMSLLAGIMVLCTVFSVMPDAAGEIVGAGNEGLTFIWVPQLFAQIPGGRFFQGLFFLALVFAAWTSLVAMIEMASRVLMDLGLPRSRAILMVGAAGVAFGIPSALNLKFFQNQDWVWGVALMVSGFFFAFAVLRYGVTQWRETFINQPGSDIHIGAWWDWAIRLVAVEAAVLAGWWLWGARSDDVTETRTLFSAYNVGSVLIQFAVVLVALIAANRWLAARVSTSGAAEEPT